MSLTNVYFKAPVWLQNVACASISVLNYRERYGGDFPDVMAEYRERREWSADRLADYRDHRLRKMVDHCYRTVPYYTRLFNDLGVAPSEIKTIDDLRLLPVLSKDDVRACPDDFLSSDYRGKRLIHRHTSGTTGSSFQFVMDPSAYSEQWAVVWRYWEGLGIEFGKPHAMFGTRRIVAPSQTRPPFWRSKAALGEVYFSAFHESDDLIAHYFDEIETRHLEWIHGYPSLVTPLASYMVENGKHLSRPLRHLTLAAESLLPHQKSLMVEAFGVEPRMHYASSEGVANASQNTVGDRYYIDEDYAVMEVVPVDGSDECIIVGTSLTNYAMPLLRWRMQDVAQEAIDERGYRYLTKVEGRVEDYLLLPSGRKIGKLDHVFKDTRHFREAQIHQLPDYSVELIVVATGGDSAADEKVARRELQESGCDVPISFRYVDCIPKTKAGKLKFVVSEVTEGRSGVRPS